MSVIFQFAGKANRDAADKIKPVFDAFAPTLKSQPGFERASLLVSHATLQVQVLLYWQTYEAGTAFNAGGHSQLAARLLPYLENEGTLVASVLEAEIAAAPTPARATAA